LSTTELRMTLPATPAIVRATSHAGERRWRPFLTALVPAALACAAVTVWLGLKIGGDGPTTAVSDVAQGVPAFAAAATCGWAARKASGRLRWAWTLLGASAASWGLGEAVWTYYTVALGVAVPFPSAADAGYLGAIPLAVCGVLAFPAAANRGTTRLRAVLDGAMVALSLLFVSWALGLGQIYHQSQASLAAQLIGLAYPVGDILIGTVLFVAVRRALPAQRGRLMLLLGGLAASAFSDSAFAFLTASGSFLTSSYLFSTGWIYGYTMVALAPLWPQSRAEAAEEGPITVARMMMPWFALLAVVLTAVALAVTHSPMDSFLALPGGGLVLVLMASQALAYKDSLSLLSQSRRAEADLKERTTLLNQVIDHAPQGVARVGTDMRITNVNPRLVALLNATSRIVIGSALTEYLAPEEVAQVFGRFKVLADGSDDTFEADSLARRADGSTCWLQWSATAVRRNDGTVQFFLAMFEDISAKHEAEETAMANLSQLEKLNRLKSEFVSMVSHEFRTALVGIQGFSEILRDEQVEPPEVKELAGDINNDAQRLNRMITEMLDLDRMEAGKLRLEVNALDLNRLVADAAERARVSSAKHAVRVQLTPGLPAVAGDSDRLTQVVGNLLSNAVKYSPDGGDILVRSHLVDHQIQVTVTDHGLGIPPEFIHRLFGRYERFEDKHAGKIIGSGLGLAITRQIVEMHGGKIWVESKVGSGSQFAFTIPIQEAGTSPIG
jgi:two-component system, sensor histidine kinase and response regulator